MGFFCCCLHNECEDYVNPNGSVYRNCTCLRCVIQNMLYTHMLRFERGEEHARLAGSSSIEGTNCSLSGMYCSPPRPLPDDVDPRYIRVQQNEDRFYAQNKCNDSSFEDEINDSKMKSLLKASMVNETTGFANIYPSSEEEDECPTCLEEYTSENPKIVTKCSHHFHLGCIYEWMERSEKCPVCGKVMAFDETI